ncbi:MAG: IS110 family transposase, partial [Gemmatimonadaceae bacterium]
MHKDSVVVAVLPPAADAPTRVERHPHDLRKLRRLFVRLAAEHPGTELRACYEASGAGYVLQRAITAWGHHCDVVAPSLIPTRPGHQRKHDRYDASQLARLYRAGELTVIHIPAAEEEALRDLVRCRTTLQRQLHRARQHVIKFLTRRGV